MAATGRQIFFLYWWKAKRPANPSSNNHTSLYNGAAPKKYYKPHPLNTNKTVLQKCAGGSAVCTVSKKRVQKMSFASVVLFLRGGLAGVLLRSMVVFFLFHNFFQDCYYFGEAGMRAIGGVSKTLRREVLNLLRTRSGFCSCGSLAGAKNLSRLA